tara:strand:+ start:269 stop:493 length:225 start_codon:yes stop_codon:yes gene_type:complete
MYKCDICACYVRKPNKIGRKDNATKELITYRICDICMNTDKRTVEQKFAYIEEKLKYRGNFQISSSRHRPKEKK